MPGACTQRIMKQFHLLVLTLVLAAGCARSPVPIFVAEERPIFYDDGSTSSILSALDHHAHYLLSLDSDTRITIGDSTYSNLIPLPLNWTGS